MCLCSQSVCSVARMKAFMIIPREGTQVMNVSKNENLLLIEFISRPALTHLAEFFTNNKVNELYLIGEVTEVVKKAFGSILDKYESLKYKIIEDVSLRDGNIITSLLPIIKKYVSSSESFLLIKDRTICDISLEKLIETHHKNQNTLVTVVTTKKEAICSRDVHYRHMDSKLIDPFQEYVRKKISANESDVQDTGVYLLKAELLSRDASNVFGNPPNEVASYRCSEDELCLDISTAVGYLNATKKFLYKMKGISENKVVIDPSAQIDKSCVIGPCVVIGANSKIGRGTRLKNAVIMDNSEVRSSSYIENAILGYNTRVGKWTRISGSISVLSTNVEVNDEVYVNDCFVFPHKTVSSTTVGKDFML